MECDDEVIEKIEHIDRYKDSGDVYTRDDVIAISKMYELFKAQRLKIATLENDIDFIKKSISEILNKI